MRLKIHRRQPYHWVVEERDDKGKLCAVYGIGNWLSFQLAVVLAGEIIRHKRAQRAHVLNNWNRVEVES